MRIESAPAIPDVLLVTPDPHDDERGLFVETFRAEWLPALDFVQDNHAVSRHAGTVRGLHFQAPPRAQAKLVRVTRGRILDVAVDLRVGSPTYGSHIAVHLDADTWRQVLVPEGFAHGYVTLDNDTEVLYKVTDYYSASHDAGIRWDDPALGIDWGIEPDQALVSDRDAALPALADLASPFRVSGGGR